MCGNAVQWKKKKLKKKYHKVFTFGEGGKVGALIKCKCEVGRAAAIKQWWRCTKITWQLFPQFFYEHICGISCSKLSNCQMCSPSFQHIKFSVIFLPVLYFLGILTGALSLCHLVALPSSAVAPDLRNGSTYSLSWWTNFNSRKTAADGNVQNFAFSLENLFEICDEFGWKPNCFTELSNQIILQ